MGNSLHKDAEHRRQAALPILAIATAIAAVGALPGNDFDLFIASTNFPFGTLALAVWNFDCFDHPLGVPAVFISSAFAQTAPAAAAGGGDLMSSLTGMLPLVLMFVVLYFVMIRPQMKRQKEHRAMIEAIAKGDEVATAGGIIGKVTRLSEGFLHIEIANNVEVQIQRSAVVQVLPKGTVK